ncbi:LysR family transcriptional regulator [Oenococcus alcoholitolerans]|uniref:LysR family transcriptional regulator n=1 Tax=Oenococcus alcoholitolerans TaxID=931074 RepID=UPI003F7032F2
MKFTDLEYFQRLAKVESFSQTAAFFNVSQPTISYAIQRLEKEFKQELVTRNHSHGRVQLTKAGKILEKYTERILTQILAAHDEIDQLVLPEIQFGLPQIIGNYYFSRLMKHFIENPALKNISTHEAGSDLLLNALKNRKLDIALISSKEPISSPELTAIEIDRRPYRIVVRKDDPLAQEDEVSFSQLADRSFVALKEGNVHPLAFNQLEERYQVFPKIIYRSPDINILKKMILEKAGIGFFADIAIEKNEGLKMLKIKGDELPQFIISFVYRNTLPKKEIHFFVDQLKRESLIK